VWPASFSEPSVETTDGRVLIEPVHVRRWGSGFLESFGRVSKDFGAPPRPKASKRRDDKAASLFGART
jgi:hypothetical protein